MSPHKALEATLAMVLETVLAMTRVLMMGKVSEKELVWMWEKAWGGEKEVESDEGSAEATAMRWVEE